jgi:NhaP-type Na+/H+ or K+/H+ antiporter
MACIVRFAVCVTSTYVNYATNQSLRVSWKRRLCWVGPRVTHCGVTVYALIPGE